MASGAPHRTIAAPSITASLKPAASSSKPKPASGKRKAPPSLASSKQLLEKCDAPLPHHRRRIPRALHQGPHGKRNGRGIARLRRDRRRKQDPRRTLARG